MGTGSISKGYNMKHTPGPWTYDSVFGLIMGPRKVEVAACHVGRGSDAKANAQLIALAPEMLELLKYYQKMSSSGMIFDQDERFKFLELVDRAVLMAEGKI